jgi:glycosyltransferase involved in cell wall biosynthesis
LPVVIHALGCDINEYSKYLMRRIQISTALKNSDLIVVKSNDLAKKTIQLGANENNLRIILNGVDQDKFYQQDMQLSRLKLGLDPAKKYLLFVGNIQQEKGLKYLIEAMAMLGSCEFELLIIGAGPLEDDMKALVVKQGLESVVQFLGCRPHNCIPRYLNAVNALCLPSIREGCPNIVLESLSCGTPVLASRVGAVPEIITEESHGMIVSAQSADQLAREIPNILKIKTNKPVTFDWYSWDRNAEYISHVFKEILP